MTPRLLILLPILAAACRPAEVRRTPLASVEPPFACADSASIPVRTAAFEACIPSGWMQSAPTQTLGRASGRWGGAEGWAEWSVGPFAGGLPPRRPERAQGRGDWAARAGRSAQTYVAWSRSGAEGWTYWQPTDDAPAVVLRTHFVGDTTGALHERLLGTLRFTGAHALPPRSYFPGSLLHPGNARGAEFAATWYSGQLRAMGEPRLAEYGRGHADEAWRITIIPSFRASYAVRMERRGRQVRVVTTVLSGAGGYEPGEPVRRDSASVPVDAAAALSARADSAGFWRMPTAEPSGRKGADGDRWILEGYRAGEYHVVDRWNPDFTGSDPAFLELARALLRVGGVAPGATR